jgi:hypothetical protein
MILIGQAAVLMKIKAGDLNKEIVMKKKNPELKLGMKAKDIVTGYEGIVISICAYISGCDRVSLQAPMQDGKIPEGHTFDVTQLQITDTKRILEVTPEPAKIELGQKVKEPMSGLTGVAYGRCVYLNGCARIAVVQEVNRNNDMKMEWLDEEILEVTHKKKVVEEKQHRTGGPGPKVSHSLGKAP